MRCGGREQRSNEQSHRTPALFGGLNPAGIVLSSLFFGALMVGAESMQRAVGVPIATIYLMQGLVVIFVLARRVLRRRARA